MTGLLLLVFAVVWFLLTVTASYALTLRMKGVLSRSLAALSLWAVLMPLPLVDEFVGRQQFEQLCRDNAAIVVDRSTAIGKTVYLAKTPDLEVQGTWVRVVLKPWRFMDATTSQPVVSYNTLSADGGWLKGLSEGGVPLTFKGSCEPRGAVDPVKLLKELRVTQIQRSALETKEHK